MTQADITKAAEELHGRISEKENLNIKINEQMQQRERLRQRQTALSSQINTLMDTDGNTADQKKATDTAPEATTGSSFNQTKIRTKTDAMFQKCKSDPKEKCCPLHDPFVKRKNA